MINKLEKLKSNSKLKTAEWLIYKLFGSVYIIIYFFILVKDVIFALYAGKIMDLIMYFVYHFDL
ncbi:hypothetical protein C0583_03475 [Candidatus Parcubacteria bacterium]|nr:MAG: hypothetical protein C0583_03475 [Candidatus Parcubacteria bacterium]